MYSTWDYLTDNLNQQVLLYSNLRDTLLQEKDYLIKNQTSQISENVLEQDKINFELDTIQQQFGLYTSQVFVGEQLGCITLSKLISVAPPQYREELYRLQKQLQFLSKEIEKYNTVNKNLVNNKLKYVRHMMKNIMDINNIEQTVYNNTGKKHDTNSYSSVMDIVA